MLAAILLVELINIVHALLIVLLIHLLLLLRARIGVLLAALLFARQPQVVVRDVNGSRIWLVIFEGRASVHVLVEAVVRRRTR